MNDLSDAERCDRELAETIKRLGERVAREGRVLRNGIRHSASERIVSERE